MFVSKRMEARTGAQRRSFRKDQQGTWTGLSDCNEGPVLFSALAASFLRDPAPIAPMDTYKLHRVLRAQEGSDTSVARNQANQEGLMDAK